jgi:hypothetical protein
MKALRNPYRTSKNRPWIRESWVVYLDILGFSASVLDASATTSEAEHLDRLRAALTEAKRDLVPKPNKYVSLKKQVAPYAVKLFTDNIVIGFPIQDDGESEFGRVISTVGLYQYSLLRHGFFVRGGMTVGHLYMDEDMVYGSGLLDAYAAETKLARDPRIVLAPAAMDLIHHHLVYYAKVAETPHNQHLLVDADSQMFVNYLALPIDGVDDIPEEYVDDLTNHRDLILSRLKDFDGVPSIWSKYAWSGTYHNVFCSQFVNAPNLMIDTALLTQPPRQLKTVYRKGQGVVYRGDQVVAKFKSMSEYKRPPEPE